MRASCLQGLKYHYDAIEDFDKAIQLSPKDCNNYFTRSVSKGAVLDYEGQVADLEKAIELSRIKNDLNKVYDEKVKKNGHNGITGFLKLMLLNAKMDLEYDMEWRKKILDASPEQKAKLEKMFQERKELRLKNVKRRQ